MTATLASTVPQVTREVLETMFFSEAEPASCAHPGDCVAARVRFDGNPRGELTVMLSRTLALSASASFLAEDSGELNEEKLSQVACELANMICGAILSRLHPHARVSLDSPQLAGPDYDAAYHQCFATPDGMLAVSMRMA